MKIRRCERICREVLSDRVKIPVVHEGTEDDDLMHAARLSTYLVVRQEI